jgi:hypothetical protein
VSELSLFDAAQEFTEKYDGNTQRNAGIIQGQFLKWLKQTNAPRRLYDILLERINYDVSVL